MEWTLKVVLGVGIIWIFVGMTAAAIPLFFSRKIYRRLVFLHISSAADAAKMMPLVERWKRLVRQSEKAQYFAIVIFLTVLGLTAPFFLYRVHQNTIRGVDLRAGD